MPAVKNQKKTIQQQKIAIKRDIATAAAAMRVGYSSNNRHELMNTAYLPSQQVANKLGLGSLTIEPGFRVYGKNSAVQDQHEPRKFKKRTHKLSKLIDPVGKSPNMHDFSFRDKGSRFTSSPHGLMSRSMERTTSLENPYAKSQGGKFVRNPLTESVLHKPTQQPA